MRDELLGYYERELVFLRRMGAEFARKYPKIASRLLLDGEKIEDPHVERMIESFAFLTGRVVDVAGASSPALRGCPDAVRH